MLPRATRVILSSCLAVFVLAGTLGAGYAVWDPDPPGDPDAVVLRAAFVGGGPAVRTYQPPAPDLVVYGDGRITVTKGAFDGSTWGVKTLDARLTRDAYREMYRDARLAGLGTSRTFDADEVVVDGGSLQVEFLFEGSLRRTRVRAGAEGVREWMIERLVRRLRELPVSGGDDLVAPATTRRSGPG
jgi:hypothetical protein